MLSSFAPITPLLIAWDSPKCTSPTGEFSNGRNARALPTTVTPCAYAFTAIADGRCACSPAGSSSGPNLSISHFTAKRASRIVPARIIQSGQSLTYKISALARTARGSPIIFQKLSKLNSRGEESFFNSNLAVAAPFRDTAARSFALATFSSEMRCNVAEAFNALLSKRISPKTPSAISAFAPTGAQFSMNDRWARNAIATPTSINRPTITAAPHNWPSDSLRDCSNS